MDKRSHRRFTTPSPSPIPYQKQYRASYDIPINDNLNLSLYGQHGDIGLSKTYFDPMQDREKKENLIKARLRYRF